MFLLLSILLKNKRKSREIGGKLGPVTTQTPYFGWRLNLQLPCFKAPNAAGYAA
jgi:hypothetical protein